MKNIELLKQSILRFVVVTGLIIAIGYLLHHEFIFNSRIVSFQFLLSGVTIGISFSLFRIKYYREGMALLLLWYIISVGSFSELHTWLFILSATYICVIAAAVYFYLLLVGKSFIKGILIRIFLSTFMIALANGLIIIILLVIANLFSHRPVYAHFPDILKDVVSNLIFGAQFGLLMGIGIELSEYLSNLLFIKKKGVN